MRTQVLYTVLLVTYICVVMVSATDHYATLEIARDAGPREIKQAYRARSLSWHPDKNPKDKKRAEEQMMNINSAYEVLSDPDQRESYDQELHAAENTHYHQPRGFDFGAEAWDEQQAWEQDQSGVDYLYDADTIIRLDGSNHLDMTRLKRGSVVWLVQFYRPWSSRCREETRSFLQTAAALRGKARVAAVNCDAEEWLCRRHGVRDFPSYLLLSRGKVETIRHGMERDLHRGDDAAVSRRFVHHILQYIPLAAFRPGRGVHANWRGLGEWLPGVVLHCHLDGTVDVSFRDGTKERNIPCMRIKECRAQQTAQGHEEEEEEESRRNHQRDEDLDPEVAFNPN